MIEYVKPEVAAACYENFINLIYNQIKVSADARYFVYKDTDNDKEKGFTEGMRYAASILLSNKPYFEKYFLEEVNDNVRD